MRATIREYGAEDRLEFMMVQRIVYSFGVEGAEDPPSAPDFYLGVELDGRPVSVCDVEVFDVARGDADLPLGGIAGVATLPEHRQAGHASNLMLASLRHMKDRGLLVAALYPYREAYYRRFGYEYCGWRWRLSAPTHRLTREKLDMPVRRLTPDEALELDPCYTKFVRGLSGSALRTPARWRRRLGKRVSLIYAVGDPIEGYFWGTGKSKEFWEDYTVGEFVWSSDRAYRALMTVLGGICTNQSQLIWNEPPRSRALMDRMDEGIEAQIARASMFRCLDVPGSLRALRPEEDAEFSIEVIDSELPENQGPWVVRAKGGLVEVAPATAGEIRLDIRQFSQAFMGSPTLADLAHEGLVSASDASLKQAMRVLSPMPVVCMEFF